MITVIRIWPSNGYLVMYKFMGELRRETGRDLVMYKFMGELRRETGRVLVMYKFMGVLRRETERDLLCISSWECLGESKQC